MTYETYILDTSFLVGLLMPRDKYHKEARKTLKSFDLSRTNFILSDYVFDETMTIILERSNCAILANNLTTIAKLVEEGIVIRKTPLNIEIVEVEKIMAKYCDQNLSFTDCLVLLHMRQYSTRNLLSFDESMVKVGKFFDLK